MRPPNSWTDLAGRTVGLWGMGVEGSASLRKLASMGMSPVQVDDHPVPGDPAVLATADTGLAALLDCDVVIKTPGISKYRPEYAQLEAAGVAIRSGLGLWLEDVDAARVACITGTKGKSTTTALAQHLLTQLGFDARVGGNIGQPPWDPTGGPAPDIWLIETSSFQVPELTKGPPVVGVTSLSPDHLDWHGNADRYFSDKLALCTKPGVGTVVADGSDMLLRAHADALGPHVRWVEFGDQDPPAWMYSLGLPGRHNLRNVLIAQAVLVALGIDEAGNDQRLEGAAAHFVGLSSRCQSVGFVGQVEFVDDSLSTNVLPARAALEAYADRPVALLVGGSDRGIDYADLGQAVAARVEPTMVVTLPDNGPRIGLAIREAVGSRIDIVDAEDLDDAVARAFTWSVPGGVVLLSPAAPSFGRYVDYRDRARAFAAAAERCGPLS